MRHVLKDKRYCSVQLRLAGLSNRAVDTQYGMQECGVSKGQNTISKLLLVRCQVSYSDTQSILVKRLKNVLRNIPNDYKIFLNIPRNVLRVPSDPSFRSLSAAPL